MKWLLRRMSDNIGTQDAVINHLDSAIEAAIDKGHLRILVLLLNEIPTWCSDMYHWCHVNPYRLCGGYNQAYQVFIDFWIKNTDLVISEAVKNCFEKEIVEAYSRDVQYSSFDQIEKMTVPNVNFDNTIEGNPRNWHVDLFISILFANLRRYIIQANFPRYFELSVKIAALSGRLNRAFSLAIEHKNLKAMVAYYLAGAELNDESKRLFSKNPACLQNTFWTKVDEGTSLMRLCRAASHKNKIRAASCDWFPKRLIKYLNYDEE